MCLQRPRARRERRGAEPPTRDPPGLRAERRPSPGCRVLWGCSAPARRAARRGDRRHRHRRRVPSARFETIGGENDVPVADNLGPFEPERYFDGARVREQASAAELKTFYLDPLGIDRRDCWVTDVVKVFLFKDGHREKYDRLGVTPPRGYARERFEEIALKSIPWIERELDVAEPKLVITLGAEIAGLLRGVSSPPKRNALLGPVPTPLQFGNLEVPCVHLAHPGIVMRRGDGVRNPWPRLHAEEHVPKLREWLVSHGLVRPAHVSP